MEQVLTMEIDGEFHTVNFPNVGQIFKIRSLSLALSSNQYTQFVESDMKIDSWTLLAIDMISTFSVILPNLKNKFKTDFLQMSPIELNKYIKVYKNVYLPWYEFWNKEFKDTMDEILKGEKVKNIDEV